MENRQAVADMAERMVADAQRGGKTVDVAKMAAYILRVHQRQGYSLEEVRALIQVAIESPHNRTARIGERPCGAPH